MNLFVNRMPGQTLEAQEAKHLQLHVNERYGILDAACHAKLYRQYVAVTLFAYAAWRFVNLAITCHRQ